MMRPPTGSAFRGQAMPADYGSDRRSIGVTAVDALRQHLGRHDSVESELTHDSHGGESLTTSRVSSTETWPLTNSRL